MVSRLTLCCFSPSRSNPHLRYTMRLWYRDWLYTAFHLAVPTPICAILCVCGIKIDFVLLFTWPFRPPSVRKPFDVFTSCILMFPPIRMKFRHYIHADIIIGFGKGILRVYCNETNLNLRFAWTSQAPPGCESFDVVTLNVSNFSSIMSKFRRYIHADIIWAT